MKRTAFAFLLIPLVCAASCALASAPPVADGVRHLRILKVGAGISVRAGRVLTSLPPGQRYRFVPPDSLAIGLASDDEASFGEPLMEEWRKTFSTVVGNGRWVESADSAQFDVTMFTTERTSMRREPRPQLAVNVTPCGAPSTQLQLCTDNAIDYAEQWSTLSYTVHILRRRSDGAVRIWRHGGIRAASLRSEVAQDLREMLRAGEN